MTVFSRFALILTVSSLSVSVYAQTTPGGSTATQGQTTQPAAQQQTGRITGKLADAKNQPVSYATVTLLRADSSVVNGDLTKDDGSFTIAPTGTGTFMLRVSAIGIKQDYIKDIEITQAAPNKSLGTIKVTATTNALKNVNVVGEKPLMELQVDKKVFNVEKNTTAAGGSASDVLSNVPSVSVDVDGNVSLRGKSDVTILIDGKPATLLGTDAASALQSLPASSIESVEVITNPSAKYDAQGLTGIINIITKKDQKLGINGNVTAGAGTGDKYNGSLGLNLRKGKWNVFLNSNVRLNRNYNNTTTDRDNHTAANDSFYHTYEHAMRHFNGFFNTIGATYNIDKNNSITFTQNINKMSFGFNDAADYYKYGSEDKTDMAEHQYRSSNGNGGPLSFSSALDYTRKFKKQDEQLNVDATFATTQFTHTQHYDTYLYDGSGTMEFGGPVHEDVPSNGTNTSFNAWADYTDPLFTKNGRLGLGFKTQFYSLTSSNNPVIDSPDNIQIVDTTLMNNYQYTQQIHAGYVNWSDKEGKFSYQAGLRIEDAIYSGTNKVPTTLEYSNSFLNLFPSAFLSYQLPNNQSIYLNYSRRTDRPSFWQLLPYKDVSTPGLVREGNPSLVPEFIHNIEFSYSKQTKRGDNIILDAYYQYTENLIEHVTTVLDSSAGPLAGSLFTQPENLAHGETYGVEATGHIQILPIWDATINANFFQNNIEGGNSEYASYFTDENGFTWQGKINTNIKLPANFSLQINGNYESPKVVAQGKMQEVYWVDAAIRKNFWKNKATLIVNVSDIFNTRKYTTIYNLPVYNETYYRDRETRVGNITFTYRFGKTNFSKGSKHGKPEMNEEQQTEERNSNLKQGDDNDQQGGPSTGGGAHS